MLIEVTFRPSGALKRGPDLYSKARNGCSGESVRAQQSEQQKIRQQRRRRHGGDGGWRFKRSTAVLSPLTGQ
jgi:hypothetical protein